MTRALLVFAVALAFVPNASAVESTIYPGVGIGKIKLGNTRAQVVRVLGKDYIADQRSSKSLELGWNFGSWTVTFIANRVVQVAVTVQNQKTPAGVGPGSSWRELVRAYPHGVCTSYIDNDRMRGWFEYVVPHKGGTQTIYLVKAAVSGPFSRAGPSRVTEVHVRAPFERLPEFGRDWPYHCHKDWRTADNP